MRGFFGVSRQRCIRSTPLKNVGWKWKCLFSTSFQGDPLNVLPTLARIEQITGEQLDYPRFVTVGDQSSGKSSVMEALIGREFFPKKDGLCTKRPLCLTLQNTKTGEWAEFEDGDRIYDMAEVRKRIERENLFVGDEVISSDPIWVKFYSPDVWNLHVVDLPGYISVSTKDKGLPKQIRSICKPYVENKNSIPLVVLR